MTRRRIFREGWIIPALASAVLFSWYRAHLVDRAYGSYTGCLGCLDVSVWANDGYLGAAFLALFALSRVTSQWLVRAVLAGVVAGAAIAYGIDVLVFRLLAQRLITADVLHFAGESDSLFTVVHPLLTQPEGWLLLGGIVATAFFGAVAILSGPARPRIAALWGTMAAIGLAAASGVPQPSYLHQEALRNLVQVNLEPDPGRPYSAGSWRAMLAAGAPAARCEAALDRDVPVILVVVESLSSYQSHLFSGLNDFTPNLDRLARANTYFPHFYANGFSTEGGLIALLTGYVPIPTAGRTGSVFAFTEVRGDFHRELQRQKYTTAFFTTGDLRFGQRARWLSEIGIAYAEGSAHPAYAGMPRGPFDAASDAALFDRFLSWYDDERAPGPFMATVLTVRTHPPYLASDGTPDEQERFREVDRQLARFVDGLEERNFFADGLLLIVGDHRAMTPVPEEEQVTMAPSAGNRVPLVAIGKGAMARGAIEGPFQQTDLIPSLTYLIGDHACRNTWQGRFVGSPPQPARFVVHADGLRRSELDVVEGAQAHRLLLDGDDTRWVDPPRSRQEAREVLFEVNRERMRRMSEFTASR